MTDNVNHPAHYTRFGKSEVIDITEQLMSNRGKAVKYLARAGHKEGADELEDLKKAQFYVNREVKRVEALRAEEEELIRTKEEQASKQEETDIASKNSVGHYIVEDEEIAFDKPVFLYDSKQDDWDRKPGTARQREDLIRYVRDELQIKGYVLLGSKKSVGYHVVECESDIDDQSFFEARCGKIDFNDIRPVKWGDDGPCFICFVEPSERLTTSKRVVTVREDMTFKKGKTIRDGQTAQKQGKTAHEEAIKTAVAGLGAGEVPLATTKGNVFHAVKDITIENGKGIFIARCGTIDSNDVRPLSEVDRMCYVCSVS